MHWVRDNTGRFSLRPYYLQEELDDICERVITEFMDDRCGGFQLPIPTSALTKLIERDAADLDLYADLSDPTHEVHGVTHFLPGQKPRVRIWEQLSLDGRREHRLRTTLTHEYTHILIHKDLFDKQPSSSLMFPELASGDTLTCHRDQILNAADTDWMEWQAGYGCGSILMPITSLRHIVSCFLDRYELFSPLNQVIPAAFDLASEVAVAFDVSQDAARIRLLKIGILTPQATSAAFQI